MSVSMYKELPNSSQQQKALTGGVNMKLPSVVTVLGFLCLLLADGFPVGQGNSPKIIGPDHIKIKVHPGELVFLHCEAFANSDEMTLIYWLIDGSFPEDIQNSDRIVEAEELSYGGGAILQKSLLLKNVTSEDLKSTFTCVVTNAAGMCKKNITLVATVDRDCNGRKKRKHTMSLQ